ncbi:hypothetical protein Thimo_1858 [Thioflavicoccus mobilis 8321]|uniref:Uncharacterized protein n=1 Tax=Thioflavicoccus mobilis 8321 TaxID=765912 RepID=L0GXB4_9GAMM|nr:hypothetical protein [Thioflavicoccus mobilis]AGA90626.1 hypothetical protein Thimo_1858 [Thioflavicoccus mobilis 8321]
MDRQTRRRCRFASPFATLAAFALISLGAPLAAPADPLKLDWPAPASARIFVEDNKETRETTTEMRLLVTPLEEGAKWRLDFPKVKLLEINGNDVSTPEELAHVPPKFRIMTEAMPSFIVDREARIVEIPGVEEMLDNLIQEVPEDTPGATQDELRMVLFEPSVIDLIRAKADRFWHLWVGIWVEKAIEPGERLDFKAESDYVGITVPAEGRFENLGEAPEHAGASHLVFELIARGDPLREAVYKSLAKAFEQAEQPMPDDITLESIKSAERRERIDLIADLTTMRPYEVRALTSLTLDIGEDGPQAKIEENVFRFEWTE